jgi:hypothetical protein
MQMDSNHKFGYPEVPLSITNISVDKQFATDVSNPFTLLEFIKAVSRFTSHTEITSYYNYYLTKWNRIKTSVQTSTDTQIVDAYTTFIKEITLNYTTREEQIFLQKIDYTNPNDLDVALSFISRKIKEIALYYSKKRDDIVLEATRKKLKGSNKGVATTVKEIIVSFFQNKQNRDDASKSIQNLDVIVGERYNASSFFNKTPDVREYNNKDRDYNLDIFLKSNAELVASVFSQTSDEFKTVNEVDSIFDNKRELTKKYMGADFFYLSASPIISDIPVVRINADYNILYNRELLLKKILANQPCYCITVNGPATLTVLKCNDTAYTSVRVVSGAVHYDCVSDMFDITSDTPILSGKKCAQQSDCVPVTTTTSPSTTKTPPLTLPPRATQPPTLTPTPPISPPGPGPKPDPKPPVDPIVPPLKPEEKKDCCDSVTLTIEKIGEPEAISGEGDGPCGYKIKWKCIVSFGECPPATNVEVDPDRGTSRFAGQEPQARTRSTTNSQIEYTREVFVPIECDTVEFEFEERPQVSFVQGGGGEVTSETETLRDDSTFEFIEEQISSIDNDTVTVPDGKGGFKRYKLDSFDNETQQRLRKLGEDIKNGDEKMVPYGGVEIKTCYPSEVIKYTLEGSSDTACCSSTTSSTTTLTPGSSTTPSPSSTSCEPCGSDTPGSIVPPEKPADGGSSVTPSPSGSEVTPAPSDGGGDQPSTSETTECPPCDEKNTSGPRGTRSIPTPAEPPSDVTYDTETTTTTSTSTTSTTTTSTTTSTTTTSTTQAPTTTVTTTAPSTTPLVTTTTTTTTSGP